MEYKDKPVVSEVVVQWVTIQQPRDPRRWGGGRDAAQRHTAASAESLLDERVL